MPQEHDVRFTSSALNLTPLTPPPKSYHQSHGSIFSSLQLNLMNKSFKCPFFNFNLNVHPANFLLQLIKSQSFLHYKESEEPINKSKSIFTSWKKKPNFCSASLGLIDHDPVPPSFQLEISEESPLQTPNKGDEIGIINTSKNVNRYRAAEEERVLISEVLVKSKDGEELDRKDLEAEALNALKASRANSALTLSEVQEDVHRVIATGFFMSCMPVAVDTRDGIRLVFQVEPNQEFRGLVCEGADALPSKFIEDAFRGGYGKIVNIRRLDEVISSINGWYMERGLFGMVSGVDILSGGIVKLQVSEAEVNNITIRFQDKTGEPSIGKTRPDTILRQLTTKKGQVYSMIQGKRDVESVLAMGVMDDVSIIPQPAGDTGKVDLTMNIVERKSGGGISGGGGISSGITSGPLAGLIGSIAIYHKNMFGRNQKINLSLERGQIDSIFKMNYTDPWIEGDDKRTSRSIMIQNSRTPGSLVHGQPSGSGLTIGRVNAGIEYSRPFRPKWNGTVGLVFQRAGAHDEKGNPILRDFFGSPLTASGRTFDDMLLAKVETVYSFSGDPASSMCVFNMDQGIPVSPEWLVFNRLNAQARQAFVVGPACFLLCLSGGHMMGKFPPHEAFPIGGTNSVRGYEEGVVGSGRSYVVSSGEMSFPLMGQVSGAIFADYGTDLGSGPSVPGDPAGARNKCGSGYGYGIGIRVDSPLGPLRLEYALNDKRNGRFHFGIGLRN